MSSGSGTPISFGAWLERRRNQLGHTRDELAQLVGCSSLAILQMETGAARPSAEQARLLAEHLALSEAERELFRPFEHGGEPVDERSSGPPTANGATSGAAEATPRPPTGLITFLFTDIEGSTRRWEERPEEMRYDLEQHDSILRAAIEAEGGYVFKTVGDAFCAAFRTPREALAAAIRAQQMLGTAKWMGSEPVRARIALHIGDAEERSSDYFGPPVNHVARLLSTGYGGQILVSRLTHEALGRNLPSSVELRDLGEYTLRDLPGRERIYQVVAEGLADAFPPLKAAGTRPGNLPIQTTPFIGREAEIAAAADLLGREDVRLLTLTGPGGTGKTRLALEVAAHQADSFADGVFFVSLALVDDPELVCSAIAQVLGVRETGRQPLLDSLKYFLRDKRLLLVLDNFEQVLGAATVVAELLTAAPMLKTIVTSRTLLRVSAEYDLPIAPLAVPDPAQLPAVKSLGEYEAVHLFVDRASALKPDFRLAAENAQAVAQICWQLDGLPLAIELAAARIRLLPPQAMLARLSSRLKLLTGGARDLPTRQQTLRGAIDWSYDLLEPAERILFRRMSIFAGGGTLDAIEAVCFEAAELDLDLLDGVQALVDRSLLRQEEGGQGEPRFEMLRTIREYGLERLAESDEMRAVRERHAAYYARVAEAAESDLRGPRQIDRLRELETEHDNFRAALRWSEEDGEPEIGLRLCAALGRFWFAHGHLSEGRRMLESALVRGSALAPRLRARALYMAGRLAMIQGDYVSARTRYELSKALFSEASDRQGVANALNDLGNVSGLQGDYMAERALHEESLSIFREVGDHSGIASALLQLGNVLMVEGDHSAARVLVQESLDMLRQLGDVRGIAMSLFFLGNADLEQGRFASARDYYDEGLRLFRQLGDKWTAAALLVNMGNAVCAEGSPGDAGKLFEESLSTFRELGARRGAADALAGLGMVARQLGDLSRAGSLLRESLQIRRELGNRLGIIECLEGLAQVASQTEQPDRAARLAGAAKALREAMGSPLPPADQADLDRALASVRGHTTEDGWLAAWRAGRELSLDEAVLLALQG